MKKITVEICVGTSCYVMGASELMMVQEDLTPEQREMVDFKGATCMDTCMNSDCGRAPFVRIDHEILTEVTVASLKNSIEKALSKK